MAGNRSFLPARIPEQGFVTPGGDYAPLANDDIAFHQLHRENLITLLPVGENQWRGSPTALGIAAVRTGLASTERIEPLEPPLLGGKPAELRGAPLSSEAGQPCSSQVETVKSFLSSFPLSVRAAVEAEQIRGERAFVSAIRNSGELRDLVKKYIMRVFLAFVRAVCKLASNDQFEIRNIESTFQAFLELLATEACNQKLWGKRGRGLLGGHFVIKPVLDELRTTLEWGQYETEFTAVQDKLLAALDRQAKSEASAEQDEIDVTDSPKFIGSDYLPRLPEEATADDTGMPNEAAETISERRKRRQEFLDPILKGKRMTVNQWADAANAEGVSHSTVFRYYNGQTRPRIDTLQKLAGPLGLKAENLPA